VLPDQSFTIEARDVDGASWTAIFAATAGNSPSATLDHCTIGATAPAAGAFTTINGATPTATGLAALAAANAEALRNAAGATSGVFPISQIQSRSIIQLVSREHDPAKNQSYFFGGSIRSINDFPTTTEDGYRRFYFPAACRVKAGIVNVSNLGDPTGSGETFSVYIRKNGNPATEYLISSSVATNHSFGNIGSYPSGAMDAPFAAGDYLNVRIATPNWDEEPKTIGWSVNLVVQWE
jgi:hypothetical protein